MKRRPGRVGRDWSPMNYRNLDLKVDQFVAYVNDDKINLIPPFQRGHVWPLTTRRKLIENIVQGRPIPAIFLYREEAGAKYEYNILDGKQRLESLILFIGHQRPGIQINNIARYFFDKKVRATANFKIAIGKKKLPLSEMPEDLFRDFQEYVIPTIEITLDPDHPSALDEMISLFVDINSYGERVKSFAIVKAMSKDALLESAFYLISLTQKRGKDVFYKAKKNEITKVLQTLQVVDGLKDANSKVDRMWELLVEIIMFIRTTTHRNPIEILKSFIRAKVGQPGQHKVSAVEQQKLREVFGFLAKAYRIKKLSGTRLCTNQIHFYTMITSIIAGGLLSKYSQSELTRKLEAFGQILDNKTSVPNKLEETISEYRELSARQTTHVNRREARQKKFLHAIDVL
jgi:hypothetical protein